MLGGLGLNIMQDPAMEATKIMLAFVSSLYSRRGNSVLETLTLRGVRHLEEANLSPRRAMNVR